MSLLFVAIYFTIHHIIMPNNKNRFHFSLTISFKMLYSIVFASIKVCAPLLSTYYNINFLNSSTFVLMEVSLQNKPEDPPTNTSAPA